jgi:hypothetical protein
MAIVVTNDKRLASREVISKTTQRGFRSVMPSIRSCDPRQT